MLPWQRTNNEAHVLNDTAVWVTELLTARRRKLTAAAKLALVDDQNRAVQRLALAGAQKQRPAAPDGWQRGLLERRLGKHLVERLIGKLPPALLERALAGASPYDAPDPSQQRMF